MEDGNEIVSWDILVHLRYKLTQNTIQLRGNCDDDNETTNKQVK